MTLITFYRGTLKPRYLRTTQKIGKIFRTLRSIHTDILIFYIKLMQIGGYLVSLFGLIRPLQIAVKQKVSG